jgi:dihydrofolate synthase/folylpolyglutamate synthase
VITDISLDHQNYLGNTLAEIAREKAGIIRRNGVVVTLPQTPQANDVIGNTVMELGARAVSAVQYVPPVSPASAQYVSSGNSTTQPISKYPLQVMGEEIQIEAPLVGRHQLRNVALAIAAAEELSHQRFPITAASIADGIRETHWPARFHVIPGSPEYILDVAHNPAGAWALRSTLSAAFEGRSLTFVFGAMRDKAIGEMSEILFPLADHVILTRVENPRAATPEEIRTASVRTSTDMEDAVDVESAMQRARNLAGPTGVIVITGSIYLVGEAMRRLGARI